LLNREVREECGLYVETVRPQVDIRNVGKFGDASVAFVPFCGNTFSVSDFIGVVFVCTAKGEQIREVFTMPKKKNRSTSKSSRKPSRMSRKESVLIILVH